jgi:hypothetical protein
MNGAPALMLRDASGAIGRAAAPGPRIEARSL